MFDIAFGQTGSGKTFTMNGYGEEYGVSYRTMHKVFEQLHFRRAQAFKNGERNRILAASRAKDPAVPSKSGRIASSPDRGTTTDSINAAAQEDSKEDVMKSIDPENEYEASEDGSHVSRNSEEDLQSSTPDFDYSVSVSMLEIYNETVISAMNLLISLIVKLI
jgi:hypothetical protein